MREHVREWSGCTDGWECTVRQSASGWERSVRWLGVIRLCQGAVPAVQGTFDHVVDIWGVDIRSDSVK